MNDVVNLAFLVWFTVLLAASTLRIWARIYRFLRHKQTVPTLLWRDFHFMNGLALPFAAILVVRFLGISMQGHLWWVLLTGMSACIAITIWAYYEYFVIDDRERALVAAHRLVETEDSSERATYENDPDRPESPHA